MTPDHGAGWYDRIEIIGPPDKPLPAWLTADWMPCPDCRANAFLTWVGDDVVVPEHLLLGVVTTGRPVDGWWITVAHDDTCPTFARITREARP